MSSTPELKTERLRLRAWRPEDLEPFAELNADPRVMEFFPAPLDRAESDALAQRIGEHFAKHGFGLWAVEVVGGSSFVGYVGLIVPTFEAHFTPCVEIGWRLACEHWGHGYATEAARAVLEFAFRQEELDEVVSMTVPANRRSRGVMQRLGMTRDGADDFQHPKLPEGHPLRYHVLYRLSRRAWDNSRNAH
jgi:ribosomal-protein-alanine N-acetyltransferase